MYAEVLAQAGVEHEDAIRLKQMSDALFLQHLPAFLNQDIINILRILKADGFILSIGSNTGFIEGDILRKLLQKFSIADYFSFMIFSDEINMSKPSAGFYQHVWEKTHLQKHEILHVGDNPVNDYRGALEFGFNALLITNQNFSIDDIKAKL
jgi:putative hydrolase of the HAD superfamily